MWGLKESAMCGCDADHRTSGQRKSAPLIPRRDWCRTLACGLRCTPLTPRNTKEEVLMWVITEWHSGIMAFTVASKTPGEGNKV